MWSSNSSFPSILFTIVDATRCSMIEGGDVIGCDRMLVAVSSCGLSESICLPQFFSDRWKDWLHACSIPDKQTMKYSVMHVFMSLVVRTWSPEQMGHLID